MITLNEPIGADKIRATTYPSAKYFQHILFKQVGNVMALYHRITGFMFCVNTKTELHGVYSILMKFELKHDNSRSKCDTFITREDKEEGILYLCDCRSGRILLIGQHEASDGIGRYPVILSVVKYPSPTELTEDELRTLQTFYREDILDDNAAAYIDNFIAMDDKQKNKRGFKYYHDFYLNEKFLATYYDFSIKCVKEK